MILIATVPVVDPIHRVKEGRGGEFFQEFCIRGCKQFLEYTDTKTAKDWAHPLPRKHE